MEDDFNFCVNGRRPQLFSKIETTSNLLVNERQPQFFENGRQPQFNGRRPQLFSNRRQLQHFCKWKTTTIFVQIENDLNILVNGR